MERSEKDQLGFGNLLLQVTGSGKSVHARDPDVEHYDVRSQFGNAIYQRLRLFKQTYNLEFRFDKRLECVKEYPVVVDKNDSRFGHAPIVGNGTYEVN
jgi:hypothetical protein